MKNFLFEKAEEIAKQNNMTLEEAIEQQKLINQQNSFLESNLGKAINNGIDTALKAILPNFIEDEVISIKNSLITEGFSAAVDTAIEEATNLGKSAIGIVTGTFENISQVKKAIEKGGLIDTVSDLLDTGINWAKKQGYINKNIASSIKKGKNSILNTIEDNISETLDKQVESIDKISGYIEKWQKYYEEQNFQSMEYQYNKIQKYLKEIMPIEETLKKARTIENLHELIKNNGKDFNISQEQKELAEMLAK